MARILIINDEAELVEACQMILEDAGHVVRTETSPDNALQDALDFDPALVLLDLVMPQPSGEIVAARLRSEPRTRGIPILVMSALDDAAARARGMGAEGFLAKPFDADGLLHAANRLLDPATSRSV